MLNNKFSELMLLFLLLISFTLIAFLAAFHFILPYFKYKFTNSVPQLLYHSLT